MSDMSVFPVIFRAISDLNVLLSQFILAKTLAESFPQIHIEIEALMEECEVYEALIEKDEVLQCRSSNLMTDVVQYWNHIGKLTDASGSQRFPNLMALVCGMLIIPHGNADTERLFSTMNNIKTKLRNSLSDANVAALLQVKCNGSETVARFKPSSKMMKLAKSAVYKSFSVSKAPTVLALDSESEDEPTPPRRRRTTTSTHFRDFVTA